MVAQGGRPALTLKRAFAPLGLGTVVLDALAGSALKAVGGLHLRILHDDLSVEWCSLLRSSSVLVLGSHGSTLRGHLSRHGVLET